MTEEEKKKETGEEGKESSKSKKEHKNLEPFFKDGEFIINKGYKVQKRVGYGSFGQVYKGSRTDTGEYVAIKVEKVEMSNFWAPSALLYNEGKIMKELHDSVPVPLVHFAGQVTEEDGRTFYYLAMDYMGLNLNEVLYREINRKFSAETCLHITTQVLRILRGMHNKGIIHRDIKPDNFLLGGSEASKNQIFLLDYGLATYYCDPQRKESHNPVKEEKGVCGTGMYLSLNSHHMISKSRRDDLEEICYMLAYLWTGTLPWRNLDEEDHDKLYEMIKQSKESSTLDDIFQDMPKLYKDLYEYSRSLEYEEEPDYDHWIKEFERHMIEQGINPMIMKMDWDPPDPHKELELMIGEMEAVIGELEKFKP